MHDQINRGQIRSHIHIGQFGYLFKTHHLTYTENKKLELKTIIKKVLGGKLTKL